ncbi:alpha/beta hydrolase [Rhodococcus aerolatus]
MTDGQDGTLDGTTGTLRTRTWRGPSPRWVAVLVHGYGEHVGRYEHVADVLVRAGAVVHGLDHVGHGRSSGERVVVADYEDVVTDVHALVARAREEDPGLPVVLLGHSMGGMIGARYAQRHGEDLAALVLSGPVLGRWAVVDELVDAETIPDEPLDPSTLSRDPAVGRAYEADDLVWHGPFRRTTLRALQAALATIADGPGLGELPTLWVHGEDDQLVPIEDTRAGLDRLRGPATEQVLYPGARHEVLNETNRDEVLGDVLAFVDRVLDARR